MIKNRKIRGHNRIQKEIETWKNNNLALDFDYLESSKRNYCKVWVSPFADISVSGSEIPAPKGKNRKLMLASLLAIFNSWEQQLKILNKPYYLAIWLFEPNIHRSQIVCAIDEMADFYNTTFYRPEKQRNMPNKNFGAFSKELSKFNWVYALEEGMFTSDDLKMEEDEYRSPQDYSNSQKWYKRKLKENPRIYKSEYDASKTYYFKIGAIWIGTK